MNDPVKIKEQNKIKVVVSADGADDDDTNEPDDSPAERKDESSLPDIDGFELTDLLGSGGMGKVYMAKQSDLEKPVAIKLLHSELATDPVNVKRFRQEVKAASLLTHVNLAAVYSSGTTSDGRPYLVMDYVDGRTLEAVLAAEGSIDLERFYDVFTQVTEALVHAHSKNVIHRDLKPANIMLVPGEQGQEMVKLLDFGIARVCEQVTAHGARVTQTGEVIGSPVYMSPEQCLGQKLGTQADIYSLGVVMYECLTGRTPFAGENSIQIIVKHINDKAPAISEIRPDLGIPDALEELILQMLDKNPEKRPLSMLEVLNRLNAAQKNAPKKATIKSHNGKSRNALWKRIKWKRLTALIAGLAASGTLAYFAGSLGWWSVNKLPSNNAIFTREEQVEKGDAAFEKGNLNKAARYWLAAMEPYAYYYFYSGEPDQPDKPDKPDKPILVNPTSIGRALAVKTHRLFMNPGPPPAGLTGTQYKTALAVLSDSIFTRLDWSGRNNVETGTLPHRFLNMRVDILEYLKDNGRLGSTLVDSISVQEQEISQNSPNFNRADLAQTYSKYASYQKYNGHADAAEEYFQKSLAQWKLVAQPERLSRDQLSGLESTVAAYQGLLEKQHKYSDAETILESIIERCRKQKLTSVLPALLRDLASDLDLQGKTSQSALLLKEAASTAAAVPEPVLNN